MEELVYTFQQSSEYFALSAYVEETGFTCDQIEWPVKFFQPSLDRLTNPNEFESVQSV